MPTAITKEQIAAARKVPVTIITESAIGFGPVTREGFLVDHGTRKYAQYENVPYIVYIPKGKRSPRFWQADGYKPYALILKGHHAEEFAKHGGMRFADGEESKSVLAFDPTNNDAMEKALENSKVEIVADYRSK